MRSEDINESLDSAVIQEPTQKFEEKPGDKKNNIGKRADTAIKESVSNPDGEKLHKGKQIPTKREDLQIAQLGTDKTMHLYYADIEKKKYGSCMLQQDEETKNTFQLMYYLENEHAEIDYNHPVFDLYNLLSMEHIETYGVEIPVLTCMARKLAVIRARTLQCIKVDNNSVKDYHIYDHLLDNWTDLITADVLLLHHYHERPKYRIFERRVLSWIASKMYNKPKIY